MEFKAGELYMYVAPDARTVFWRYLGSYFRGDGEILLKFSYQGANKPLHYATPMDIGATAEFSKSTVEKEFIKATRAAKVLYG